MKDNVWLWCSRAPIFPACHLSRSLRIKINSVSARYLAAAAWHSWLSQCHDASSAGMGVEGLTVKKQVRGSVIWAERILKQHSEMDGWKYWSSYEEIKAKGPVIVEKKAKVSKNWQKGLDISLFHTASKSLDIWLKRCFLGKVKFQNACLSCWLFFLISHNIHSSLICQLILVQTGGSFFAQ